VQRILRLLGAGLLAILAQSMLVTVSPVRDGLPDMVLPAVLFLATVDIDVTLGVLLSFVLGYFFDLMSGTPPGLHGLAFQVVYLGGRWAQRRFYLAGVLFEVGLTFAAVVVLAAAMVAVRTVVQEARFEGWLRLGLVTGLRAVLSAALAPAVFWAARRIQSGHKPTLVGG
jgi:rod shape-determining protein MreD